MPVALISTSTSPNFGPCRSTVSMVRGAPAFQATAALVFMGILSVSGKNGWMSLLSAVAAGHPGGGQPAINSRRIADGTQCHIGMLGFRVLAPQKVEPLLE